jgi:hypothetical protein
MSLVELRQELKSLRKSVAPVPISRMKKTEVARELERMKSLHHKEEKTQVKEHEKEVKEVKKVVKKVVEKVQKVEEKAHLVQEKKTKESHKAEEKPVEKKPETSVKPSMKVAKGSQEARDKMAAIRARRGLKTD